MPSVKGIACLYCLNCTKFGQLILRKISKIIATRCQILRLKCTKFDFRWGSLQRSPRPLAGFKGASSRQGGEGEGMGKGIGREGKRKGGGKGEKEKGWRREGER